MELQPADAPSCRLLGKLSRSWVLGTSGKSAPSRTTDTETKVRPSSDAEAADGEAEGEGGGERVGEADGVGAAPAEQAASNRPATTGPSFICPPNVLIGAVVPPTSLLTNARS